MKKIKNLSITAKILLTVILFLVCHFGSPLIAGAEVGEFARIIYMIFLTGLLFIIFNLKDFRLYTRIFMGMALGIIAGIFWADTIAYFYPVGQAFIRLIKMVVIPLVFASLLVGTASIGSIRQLGRIGVRTLLFYLASTAIAITLALMIANSVGPGSSLPPELRDELSSTYQDEAGSKIDQALQAPSTLDLLLDIIPENPARAMNNGEMLQIIFFAIISGIAVTRIAGPRKETIIRFFEGITDITLHIVHGIMRLAPYAVFALIAYVLSQYGSGIILTLFGYFATTILALAVHVILFNSLVVKLLTGHSLSDFWRGIYPALLVAFSTSSSSATLPVTMECAEDNLEVSPKIASFVLPLGSTINMDGTAIFQGVSALFIANVYGIELTLNHQLTIILTATLASVGTAGAPQVGIIMLTMVLQSIGVPLEGIALILGVERFLDMARTTVNVTSDLSCSLVMNRHEKEMTS